MKISLGWLSDYVTVSHSAEQVAEILSNIGLACEGIEYINNDAVLEVEVTTNRGDCLSYIGIARELAAATGRTLKLPPVSLAESNKPVGELVGVEIAEPALCGRYTARIIEAVKVGPAPQWLRRRLETAGLRSINNVVDATNYAMLETGQPPHAFDLDKIRQGKIIVRRAVTGEQITSIDGSRCSLDGDMLVIADPQGPVAIGGVMGGLDSEVTEATTRILLEQAYFDPVSIRTTARRLALPSEAAFRFERIVDIEAVDWASQRTAQLIMQAAGGAAAKGVIDVYPTRPTQKAVSLRLSRLHKLLGVQVPTEQAIAILAALGFQPTRQPDDVLSCAVPSWRSDVCREVDLIEEVARLYGYGKVPVEKKICIEARPPDSRQQLLSTVCRFLNGCGFYETINVAFTDPATAQLISGRGPQEHLTVRDESRKCVNLLRRSLLGSLLTVLKANAGAGNLPCRVFELASTFAPADPQEQALPDERTKLGLLCSDNDIRYLRGVIEGLIKVLNRSAEVVFEPAELPWAEVGAEIFINGKPAGYAGLACRETIKTFDLKNLLPCAAELDFGALAEAAASRLTAKPIPRFPAVIRDLSIVVDEKLPWSAIAAAVRIAAPPELERVEFVGIYRGVGIEAGKKSVTLSLRFRDEHGTLTHQSVDDFQQRIVQQLEKQLAAKLRGP
jgi:phenylalanyl-tRNA synthetase beta chain